MSLILVKKYSRLYLSLGFILFSSNCVFASPFSTSNQNPFSLISGLPLPTEALLPTTGALKYNIAFEITNTLNAESNTQEQILLDFEAYHLRAGFEISFNDDWAMNLNVPIMIRGGGVFDQAIDDWHTFFQLPRGNRPNVSNDQFQIRYINGGNTLTDLTESISDIGDIQLSIGHQLFRSSDKNISAWITFDLPTGDESNLTGNKDIDTSLYLAANDRLDTNWNLFGNLGLLLPSEAFTTSLKSEDYIWFGHIGLSWQLTPDINLQTQLNAHTRLYENSSLRLFGDTYELVFGGTIKVDSCSALQIAFSEDIKVGAAPDISLLVSWQSLIDGC